MGGEIFVNDGPGRGIEALDAVAGVAVDHPGLPDAQAMQALVFAGQWFGVAFGQGEDGRLHGPAGGRVQGALVVADLRGNVDPSPQGWWRDGT